MGAALADLGPDPRYLRPRNHLPSSAGPGPKPVPGSVTTRALGRGSRVPSRTSAPEPLPAFKGPSARGARAWGRARSGRRGGSRREASAQPPLSARGVFSEPPAAEGRNPRRLSRLCPYPGLRFPIGAKRAAGRMRRQSPPRRHRPAAIPTSPGSGLRFGLPRSLPILGPFLTAWAPGDTPGWRPDISRRREEPPRRPVAAQTPRPQAQGRPPSAQAPQASAVRPGTLPGAAPLLLFRFRFGARRFSLRADRDPPVRWAPEAAPSAPRVGSPVGLSPRGAAEGPARICPIRRSA